MYLRENSLRDISKFLPEKDISHSGGVGLSPPPIILRIRLI